MTAGQEATSQEVVKRINKCSYQFQKKGNEAQFMFNMAVEEHIESAKRELTKVLPSSGGDQKFAITKAVAQLEEGTKAIVMRLKHIRIANCSELGWGVVAAYKNNELAEDSDDKKGLFKAEEAEKKQQKKMQKLTPRRNPGGEGQRCWLEEVVARGTDLLKSGQDRWGRVSGVENLATLLLAVQSLGQRILLYSLW